MESGSIGAAARANALAAAPPQLRAAQLVPQTGRRERGIGRATVFRTLETLVDAGVARRLELDGHVYAYVACLPAHHHHIACTRCGRVDEIDEAYVTPIAERLAQEMGFEIDDARLDFYGRCAACRAEDAATA